MEYYDGRLCVSMRELVGSGIMTEANYKQMARRAKIEVVRKGGGQGKYSLVAVKSLPTRFRDLVTLRIGKPEITPIIEWLQANYERDQDAVLWVNDTIAVGIQLTEAQKEKIIVNASVLNCCIRLYGRASDLHRVLGLAFRWHRMAMAVENLRVQFGHTLPTSALQLRKKVERYKSEGYKALVSGKFGNTNASKYKV